MSDDVTAAEPLREAMAEAIWEKHRAESAAVGEALVDWQQLGRQARPTRERIRDWSDAALSAITDAGFIVVRRDDLAELVEAASNDICWEFMNDGDGHGVVVTDRLRAATEEGS